MATKSFLSPTTGVLASTLGQNSGVATLDGSGVGAQPPRAHATRHRAGAADDLTGYFARQPFAGQNALTGWYHADGFGVTMNGSTYDNTALQACLNTVAAAGGGTVYVPSIGAKTALCNGLLKVGDNTRLLLGEGVTLQRVPNVYGNLIYNSARDPIRTITDGVMTAGSPTLSSATANFTAADLGTDVQVSGAGSSVGTGGLKVLYTKIIAVANDGKSATLGWPAVTSTSGATVNYYTRNRNIRIEGMPGSTIDGTANGAAINTDLHHVMFRRVDGLSVTGVKCINTAGKYAINLGDVTNFIVRDITFNTASDGVHMNGPCSVGRVENIRGYTHDDSVAMTATDYANYSDVSGPIVDIVVDTVHTDTIGTQLKICTNVEQGAYVDRISARSLHYLGSATVFSNVNIAGDTGVPDVRGVTITDYNGRVACSSIGTLQKLTLRDGYYNPIAATAPMFSAAGMAIKELIIEGAVMPTTTQGACHLVQLSGGTVVGSLTINDVDWYGSGSYLLSILDATSGALTTHINNVDHNGGGGGGIAQSTVAGSTLTTVELVNVTTASSSWVLDTNSTAELFMTNVKSAGGINVRASGAVTVRGAGMNLGGSTVASGGVLRSKAVDFQVDVSKLAKTLGDMAFNFNASLTCGTGPVVCMGPIGWRHLVTNATTGTPTVSTGTVTGSDVDHAISVTTPASPASGTLVTTTFSNGGFSAAPRSVQITPTNAAAAAAMASGYYVTITATTVAVALVNAPPASTALAFTVHVNQ